MFSPLVNWLLVILVGLATGVVTTLSAAVVPMFAVRWGMIAAWLGAGAAGYIGVWVWLVFTADWGK